MKLGLLITTLLFGALSARADLVSTFKSLDYQNKGPFSLNYLQSAQGRVSVIDNVNPPGPLQFQAAFRNDVAKALETGFDFYTANLFTTNYYELMGQFVYDDPYGSHELDHRALLAKASDAFPKAASMTRHWVLEKSYLAFFPNSAIARGFKLRGISGAEFEQAYAVYFFNFYISSMQDETQYLPAFLLTKGSPIGASTSLDQVRDLIGAIYDDFNTELGSADPGVRALYDIRNEIHNQLSQDVIAKIDAFQRNYPQYASEDPRIAQVESILRAYYAVTSQKVSDLAGAAGLSVVQAAADDITKNGFTVARALTLSQRLADVRTSIGDAQAVPYAHKADALVALDVATEYLNMHIGAMKTVTSKDAVKAVVNLVYTEGFLIKDNWQYFLSQIDEAQSLAACVDLFADIADIANDTLAQSFAPALDQWISVEPKMQYFVDNTLKSSALNTASLIAKKIKK